MPRRPPIDPDRLVRLNKYLAENGVASRRKADELIAAGDVLVDGDIVTELGTKVDPEAQRVEVDGVVLRPQGEPKRWYLLNKPVGVVCTSDPREAKKRAIDLVDERGRGRVYTVGRLDEDSSGLVVLTNDGELANLVMHPRYGVHKTYAVTVRGRLDDDALARARRGIHLSEGRATFQRIVLRRRTEHRTLLHCVLEEGMNRQIRRVFAKLGHPVLALERVRIGPLADPKLRPGEWRRLKKREVDALRRAAIAGEAPPPPEKVRRKRPGPRGRGPARG